MRIPSTYASVVKTTSKFPKVMPYLYYPDAARALAFLVDAFGFGRMWADSRQQGQRVDCSVVDRQWWSSDWAGNGQVPGASRSRRSCVGNLARTFIYVDDVDLHCEHEHGAGATIIDEPGDHGPNRIYVASDCGGQQWMLGTPLPDEASP